MKGFAFAAVLGVAVQRQVRQHDAKAVLEALHERLQCLVGEQLGVPEHEPRARSLLAVGDARAVCVVVQPQPHRQVPSGLGSGNSTCAQPRSISAMT